MNTTLRPSASGIYSVPAQWPRQGPSSLLRRGGILLLLLVFAIAGCAGPPARQKVAVNRGESSRPRLNAQPQSKARAPVTTVKPAAPPQQAPLQQGQEQEGRIF
jgi:hypothetical protein